MSRSLVALCASALLLVLSGCQKSALTVVRSPCPAVAVPTLAGEMTQFNPPTSRDASAIDITAAITNVRGPCTQTTTALVTNVTFDVVAQRHAPGPARSIVLPFFASVVQGGNVVVSKQIGAVTLNFADGQVRAQSTAAARADVALSATQLPPDIEKRVTRKRKPGDADAAIDPMADPEVRAAVRAVTFEVLVGFQLDEASLAYNAAK